MMTKRLFSKLTRRRSRGQAMVEFALVLPVLLILLMTLIEVARLFSAWLIVENSAREAARYAVTGEFNPIHCPPVVISAMPAKWDRRINAKRGRTQRALSRSKMPPAVRPAAF